MIGTLWTPFLQEKIGIGAADLADSLDPYDTFTGAADDAWYRTAVDYGVTYMGEDPRSSPDSGWGTR